MKTLSPDLKLLYSGVNTKRYHVVPTIHTETIGHHSHMVASLLVLLYPDCKRNVIIAALFHDLAECMTGDIPSPSKRFMGKEFIDKLDALEEKVFIDNEVVFPELSKEEKHQLKVCDILAGMVRCHYETALGNNHIIESFYNFASYFREQNCTNKKAQELYDWLYDQIANNE